MEEWCREVGRVKEAACLDRLLHERQRRRQVAVAQMQHRRVVQQPHRRPSWRLLCCGAVRAADPIGQQSRLHSPPVQLDGLVVGLQCTCARHRTVRTHKTDIPIHLRHFEI